MAFAEDLSVFFNTAEFAVQATLAGAAVRGIFDNAYQVDEFTGGAAGSVPSFMLASSSVPANVIGQALVIGAATWKVVETMPDGTGVTTLRLRS